MRWASAAGLLVLLTEAEALDNGLAKSPPMGWRSWNQFGESITQAHMEEIMDAMVARSVKADGTYTSLCDLGYCDAGLDDNWQACGSGNPYSFHDPHSGRSLVNMNTFPDMASMTRRAHKLNLTAGFYMNNCICKETMTPTDDMYKQDVDMLVREFDFDGVKLDGCGSMNDMSLWQRLMAGTGKKVLIENCHWGNIVPSGDWCPWHFFRTCDDIRASYGSVVYNLNTTIKWARAGLSRPGCWAYPDMLQVGCKHGPGGDSDVGLTFVEARSHFGAWCIVSSPLVLSHDLRNPVVNAEVWPIISNREAIAVNQAWYGHAGSPFKEANDYVTLVPTLFSGPTPKDFPSWQIFYKPIGPSTVAVLLMNHAPQAQHIDLFFDEVPGLSCSPCHVYDIWNHEEMGALRGKPFRSFIGSHDSVFLLLSSLPQPSSQVELTQFM